MAPDVDSWILHAKNIQTDIDQSRRLASEIVRQAEAEERRAGELRDAETYVAFLEREVAFSLHLEETLRFVKKAQKALEHSERLVADGNALEALHSLDGKLVPQSQRAR